MKFRQLAVVPHSPDFV